MNVKGEQWRIKEHARGVKLEHQGRTWEARKVFLAVIADAKMEARTRD